MPAAGAPVSSSDGTTVEDYTIRKPLVRLIQQAAQSIATTNTAITFGAGSEDIDTHGFHDEVTNNTRVTPTIAGYYRCTGVYLSSATTAPALRATIGKNGGVVQPAFPIYHAVASSAIKGAATQAIVACNGSTDYIEFFAVNSTGGVNTQASGGFNSVLEVEFLRPL